MHKLIFNSILTGLRFLFRKKSVIFKLLFLSFFIWYIQCLPDKLFSDSTSTVLLDRNGKLLGARIAKDGQWRFEDSDSIPLKFEACILEFEDKGFRKHLGISLRGIGRAIVQNFKNKRVVSGGSTLTMQLVRMMEKNPPRTYFQKLKEMLIATRIEIAYSKDEILLHYASHAPFGNNVVGLDAASWRYYGRGPHQLSWAESATLAVLPNAPGLIYPGKNHASLLSKRNRLLKRLFDEGIISENDFYLALDEPLPEKPLPLPNLSSHLLAQFIKEGQQGKTIQCTLSSFIQQKAIQLLQNHSLHLQDNFIFNGAVMITSVKSGEVLAYVGNTSSENSEYGNYVNCIQASRSTGSILKPLLYAKSLEDGVITPKMLLEDIPSQFGGFSPTNFAGNYEGALPANEVLSKSLNIPMVHLLNRYGLSKFHQDLKDFGLSTINHPASHYGLSLILGGAEANLLDLTQVYLKQAQMLQFIKNKNIHSVFKEVSTEKCCDASSDLACVFTMFEAMTEVNRPDEDNNWKTFSSEQKIAWKTGTSFGFRDAWAIGITPDYVVSVWIGNADGEGRPGLTGVKAAAPLLFKLFKLLPKSNGWFQRPMKEMAYVSICSESGHRASRQCPQAKAEWIPKSCLETQSCPYHQELHLNRSGTFRVTSECESVEHMKQEVFFILPTIVEKYYKKSHPNFKSIPEYAPGCNSTINALSFGIVYPKNKSKIYVPVEFDGQIGKTIFEASHRKSDAILYWHLDEVYIGSTKEIHQISINPAIGKHKLTLVDMNGITKKVAFEVVGRKR
jgi:penicillin-binding protein 1C